MTQFNAPSQITCPHCGRGFAVQPQQWPQYQGRSINCTSCGKPFVVGGAGMPALPVPPPIPMGQPMNQGYPPNAYPYPPPSRGLSAGAIVLIVLGVLAIPCLISVLLPALSHVRKEAQKAKCSANLIQIGTACRSYANTVGNGEYPDSMATLAKSGLVPLPALVCPESSDNPSTNSNIKTDADLLGCCSYIYLGKGLNNLTATSRTVLAYEPLSNHHMSGINVLYGDMTVRWLSRSQAEQLIPTLPGNK